MPDPQSEPSPPSRIDLLRLAQSLGVSDADVMTRAELRAAIDKAQRPEPVSAEQYPVTWVSVARRLLASVVERGLNLPDAAALIRGDTKLSTPPKAPPPVATVTLARIYAAQGHLDRAIRTLNEVLESDPDHELARELRTQLELRREELLAATPNAFASSGPPSDDLVASTTDPGTTAYGTTAYGTTQPSANEPSAAPEEEPALVAEPRELVETPLPPGVQRIPEIVTSASAPDSSGELVAPAFDVAQRDRSVTDAPASAAFYTEPPTRHGMPSHDSETPAAPSAVSETPLAPSVFREPETEMAPETEPPQTIAASFDPTPTFPPEARPEHFSADLPPPSEPSDVSVAPPRGGSELFASEAFAVEPVATETLAADPPAAPTLAAEAPAAPTLVVDAPALAALGGVVPGNSPLGNIPLSNGAANGLALGPGPTAPEAAVAPATLVAPPPVELPTEAGLVMIETESPIRYVYWELAGAGVGVRFWIHVVTHTPSARGNAERHERRFPVQRPTGALRLEGVSAEAVMRARLTHEPGEAPAVVVAASVRARGLDNVESSFDVRYVPHSRVRPEALAHRARAVLDRASPVYWD